MRQIVFASLLVFMAACSQVLPVGMVDPMIGTGGHGHVFPGACVPHGMVQLSPDTRTSGWDACSGYHYDDSSIIGFSHTHLSGTGCADLADILVVPYASPVAVEDGRVVLEPLPFSHSDEKAGCGYYSVRAGGILAEMTATSHVGVHKYTFPDNGQARSIVFDLSHTVADDERVEAAEISQLSPDRISGMRVTTGWTPGQAVYFDALFSEEFESFVKVSDTQAVLTFHPEVGTLTVAVGLSAVSGENAALNREVETADTDFDSVRLNAESAWSEALSSITVKGGSAESRKIFYTSLYHTFIAPVEMSDVNGEYIRQDGSKAILPEGGHYWSTLSVWDTFRAWHPLKTLTDTTLVREMVRSMTDMYEASGELPIWPLWSGETGTMIGYHSVSVIADAYLRGVRGFDAERTLEAMVRSSRINAKGSDLYGEYGFVPADVKKESVSLTLEFAYDDWCIAMMAKALSNEEIYREYSARALNYINVFDGSTAFFRGRHRDGSRTDPFDIFSTGRDYTEATPWHYRFFVPHDINGLISQFGGRDSFISALDDLFSLESENLNVEVSDVSGFKGQYAHGNEPGHNFAYLYTYAGQPWKTQELTRALLDEMYSTEPDGIIGNEDCGQMSAWYVFSSIGLYPVCPGSGEFVITAPLFEEATLRLANGRTLTIKAPGASGRKYIRSVSFNGEDLDRYFIDYNELMKGGELVFKLSSRPVKRNVEALPYSMTSALTVSQPYTTASLSLFEGSVECPLATLTEGAVIRYTLDGSEPDETSALYTAPLHLDSSVRLRARAFKEGYEPSPVFDVMAAKAEYLPSLRPDNPRNGVRFKYHEGKYSSVSAMKASRIVNTGVMFCPSIADAPKEDHYGYEFEGYINIDREGVWEFYTKSDDGSKLFIDGREVVNNDGSHAAVSATGRIALAKGFHSFVLMYFEDYEGQEMEWGWRRPGGDKFVTADASMIYY